MAHLKALIANKTPSRSCQSDGCPRFAARLDRELLSVHCSRCARGRETDAHQRTTPAHWASVKSARPQDAKLHVATNYNRTYTATPIGAISVRFRQMYAERGGELLGALAFDAIGPIPVALEHCPSECRSLAHIEQLCGVLGVQSEQQWLRRFVEGANARHPPRVLRRSSRASVRAHDPSLLEPICYINWTGEFPFKLTTLQFRAQLIATYEAAVRDSPALRLLREAWRSGIALYFWQEQPSLQCALTPEVAREQFNSPDVYFGAEWAVACMLLFEDAQDYPWNAYRAQNAEIFAQTS